MKPKPRHDGWCAFDPKGKMIFESISRTRYEAVSLLPYVYNKFIANMINDKETRKRLRKEGYRVKKVKIVEVK